MWYDDFDADLYKLLPQAQEIIEPVKHINLITWGSPDKDGKLNHPSTWNGVGAFFGFCPPGCESTVGKPNTHYETGKPAAYVSDKPQILCTAEEAFRDAWPHHYRILLNGQHAIWDTGLLQIEMMNLMYHKRAIFPLEESILRTYTKRVVDSLTEGVALLKAKHDDWLTRLARQVAVHRAGMERCDD